ncbi:MAG: FkbM family methyltransferase [Candidatus Bathyarchaeia archaeon]
MHEVNARLRKLSAIRECYKNWIRIGITYVILGRFPNRVVVRHKDATISVSGKIPVYHFFKLIELLRNGWRLDRMDDQYLVLHNEDENLRMKYSTDGLYVAPLADMVLDDMYGKDFKDKVIVDIGMGNGDSAIFFAKRGAKLVLGLEPYPDNFNLAKENIKLNGIEDSVIALNLALSQTKGIVNMLVASRSPTWSTTNYPAYTPNQEMMGWFDTVIKVPATTLEALLQDFGLEHVDLLKLDCEGCEHEVISSASPDTLNRISSMIFEFHGNPSRIRSRLEAVGFHVSAQSGSEELGILSAEREYKARNLTR